MSRGSFGLASYLVPDESDPTSFFDEPPAHSQRVGIQPAALPRFPPPLLFTPKRSGPHVPFFPPHPEQLSNVGVVHPTHRRLFIAGNLFFSSVERTA